MQNEFWHTKTEKQILEYFKTSLQGLSSKQVAAHRQKYGTNTLPEATPDPVWKIFLRQFRSPLIYILFAACVLILVIGEYADAIIILFVLFFNAVVGSIQEGNAQNTLHSLNRLVETQAAVFRDGKEEIVADTQIVPGDIIALLEGDKIPADARVIDARNLTIDEASLTGESQPIHKTTETSPAANLPTADQKNMLFRGTNVVAGSGLAIVVTTGVNTIIGNITQKIAAIDSEDPIKRDIRKLSRLIIGAVATICTLLFFAGLATGRGLIEMFTTVISLSVSIIPEGLPVVLTLVLATGVWRMSKKNALVKKLQAVEALGQASVIAVDKTGTITKNELAVTQIYAGGKMFTLEASGYEPRGDVLLAGKRVEQLPTVLMQIGQIAAACGSARVAFSEEKQAWQVTGDPTEAALVVLGEKLGFRKTVIEGHSTQTQESPFSSKKRYHVVLKTVESQKKMSVVGAPETILNLCTSIWTQNPHPLTKVGRAELEELMADMSSNGLRVLAMATKVTLTPSVEPENVNDLAFVGFVGMKDTLRPGVRNALKRAGQAGIKVVMITGDHKLTAITIAKDAGIYTPQSRVLTGEDIDGLDNKGLPEALGDVSVFARVSPEHKLRIIEAYKARGQIIAMTGDGVNDAPSLVAADLGVAMGKMGTEVAKEAADIVLLDDNFGSILSAVEEGRSIYKTIKKVILYLFSTNVGEVLVITGAIFFGLPLPLLASQIIWLNFITDGFLDVALAMEPKEQGLLNDHLPQKTSFIDALMIQRILVMAAPMALGSLSLFYFYLAPDLTRAWSVTLSALAVFQWFNAWNCRSDTESVFKQNIWSNKYLVGATCVVIILQIFALYNPFMQRFLHTTSLTVFDWLLVVTVASTIVIAEEVRKAIHRAFA